MPWTWQRATSGERTRTRSGLTDPAKIGAPTGLQAFCGEQDGRPDKLAEEIARLGHPGDLIIWRRGNLLGRWIGWRGHIAIIYSLNGRRMQRIGGNERGQVRKTDALIADHVKLLDGGVYGIARVAVLPARAYRD
jgi:hypothetical protein